MSSASFDTAAEILAGLRIASETGRVLDDLPTACRPSDLMDAYEIQRRVRPLLTDTGFGPQIGWKIGCTTPVMQDYLKIPHPCAGTLYRDTVVPEHALLEAHRFRKLGLECEIAVVLRESLPERHGLIGRDDVAGAVDSVMASIEIVEHRFTDFRMTSVASLIADDFFSWGCVLGKPVPVDQIDDLAELTGGFSVNGADPFETGSGGAILGHPLTALAWLADHAARLGTPLERGDIITLGSVVKTVYPVAGEVIIAQFEGLPTATVTVT
ncbi:MAG: fumarylacetoacetate hydrolase family protein [Pseudomonadota bacterium]